MNYFWRALQGLGVLVAIALVCLAVFISLLRSQWTHAARELPKEEAACRQAGIPLTPADLQASLPEVSPNAGPDWQALTVYRNTHPLTSDDEMLLDNCSSRTAHTRADEQKARALLQRRSDLLQLINRITDKRDANFHRDLSKGPDLLTPEYATMREAARILRAEAYLDARAGREAQALDALRRGFRVAQHASDDGTFIAYLFGVALDAITLAGAEDVLRMDPASANALGQLIARDRPQFNLRRAIVGEAVMARVSAEKIRDGKLKQNNDLGAEAAVNGAIDGFHLGRLGQPLWDAGLAIILRYERRIIEVSSLSYPERNAAIERIMADFDRESKAANARNDFTWILPNILLSVYSKLGAKEQMVHAKEAVVTAAAGVVAYHREHGAYPASLAVVGRFADPFSGECLHYRSAGKTFVVYSVGPTGHYDGQPPDERHRSSEAYFRS